MASGKMRCMEDKLRTDIEQTPLKTEIEAAFRKRNMDEDRDTIAHLFHKPKLLLNFKKNIFELPI